MLSYRGTLKEMVNMKTIGVRALRENPGVLSQYADKGEFVLVTNRNKPISLSVPFSDELIESGVHINVAVILYEEDVLTLTKAAKLAGLPVEAFMKKLVSLGVVSVDQPVEELDSDLKNLGGCRT